MFEGCWVCFFLPVLIFIPSPRLLLQSLDPRSGIVFGGIAMPTNHIPASKLGQALAFGHRERTLLIRLNPQP